MSKGFVMKTVKVISIISLVLGFLLFAKLGIGVIWDSKTAVHEILGFMLMGFAGIFIGQIGMIAAWSEKRKSS